MNLPRGSGEVTGLIPTHGRGIGQVHDRPPTEADEDRWAQWLAEEMCPTETNRDRLAAALRRRCRSEKVEPPSIGQVERLVASSCRRFDDDFAATTAGRLGPWCAAGWKSCCRGQTYWPS